MTEAPPGQRSEVASPAAPFRDTVWAAYALTFAVVGLILEVLAVGSHYEGPDAKGLDGLGYALFELVGVWAAYVFAGLGVALSIVSIRRKEKPPWPRAGLYANLLLAAGLLIVQLTLRVGLPGAT